MKISRRFLLRPRIFLTSSQKHRTYALPTDGSLECEDWAVENSFHCPSLTNFGFPKSKVKRLRINFRIVQELGEGSYCLCKTFCFVCAK